jgi:putative SOS response-associated peptidase YedK
MCGRYASYTPPSGIRALVRAINPVPNAARSWNVAPSQQAMAMRRHPETGERHLDLLTWGFLPHWAVDPTTECKPISASKGRDVAITRMFRAAFTHVRCLVAPIARITPHSR